MGHALKQTSNDINDNDINLEDDGFRLRDDDDDDELDNLENDDFGKAADMLTSEKKFAQS